MFVAMVTSKTSEIIKIVGCSLTYHRVLLFGFDDI